MLKILGSLTETTAKYSTRIAQRLQNLNDSIHGRLGYERKIVLGEHNIYVLYKKKGHTGKYSGNSDFYANGELYLKGYANPIKVKPGEVEETEDGKKKIGNVELTSSPKYRQAIKNDIIRQALNTPDGDYSLAEKLLMALVGLVGAGMVAGVIMFMQ